MGFGIELNPWLFLMFGWAWLLPLLGIGANFLGQREVANQQAKANEIGGAAAQEQANLLKYMRERRVKTDAILDSELMPRLIGRAKTPPAWTGRWSRWAQGLGGPLRFPAKAPRKVPALGPGGTDAKLRTDAVDGSVAKDVDGRLRVKPAEGVTA